MTPPEAENPTVVPAEPVDRHPASKDLGWTLSGLLIVLAYVLLVLAFLMAFRFDVVDFLKEGWVFLVPGLVFVAVLGGLSRPWTHVVAGLLVAIPAAIWLFGFHVFTGLVDPTRGIESQVAALLGWSFLWALPAAFVGLFRGIAGKDQSLSGALKRPHGHYALLVGALFAGLFLASVLATVATDDADDAYDFAADDTVRIVIEDFEFKRQNFTVVADSITEIVVENKDGAYHTFTYEAGGRTYEHKIPGGQTISFLVRFQSVGDVPYWCEPHSSGEDHDEGMVGNIEVVD